MQQQAAASMYTAHDAPCAAVDESSSTGAGSSLAPWPRACMPYRHRRGAEPAAAAGRGACAALSDQPEPAERDAGGAGRHMICMHYLSRATAARAPTTEHFDHLFYLQPEGPRKRLV